MILMKNINLNYLAGGPIEKVVPLEPYSEIVCDFFAELSKRIQKDAVARSFPDVISFAFFCRKANLQKLKEEYLDNKKRIGRGLAFHIAPSNVPVNALFTYVFGMLSGNANIVRVSTKDFPQIRAVCNIMQKMFEEEKYFVIRDMTAIVLYDRNQDINDKLSAMADARIIWGGDNTINELRKSPIGSRCIEMTFADRFSFAIMDPYVFNKISEDELLKVAEAFYNDTYLMDQNACSTPHLIIWKKDINVDEQQAQMGKKRFWNAVYKAAEKYDLADIKVSDKYVMLCHHAVDLDNIIGIEKYSNLLYIVSISSLPDKITDLRGKFGLFFQCDTDSLSILSDKITNKVQTCVYYGIEPQTISEFIYNNNIMGIDRIVPVGASLDIGVIWDGYDIIKMLSRIVSLK